MRVFIFKCKRTKSHSSENKLFILNKNHKDRRQFNCISPLIPFKQRIYIIEK